MGTIGIAGTGRMGTAFARRLIETGHEVAVWNRTRERTGPAAGAGARVAEDLAALAGCDTILLSLTDASAVDGVADGLIEAGIAGRLVIDLSTILPDETRAIEKRFAAAGADFVDCPVGGTVAPALKGQLLGMAGGSAAAFEVSIETGIIKRARNASSTGNTRSSSSCSDIGVEYGRVLSPPTSMMSAPDFARLTACSTAARKSKCCPPSEKLSGVTLRMPITSGRAGRCNLWPRKCHHSARDDG